MRRMTRKRVSIREQLPENKIKNKRLKEDVARAGWTRPLGI